MFANYDAVQAEKEIDESNRQGKWWRDIKADLPTVSIEDAIQREKAKWKNQSNEAFEKTVDSTYAAHQRNREEHEALVADYAANELAESEWFLTSAATAEKPFLLKSKNRFAKVRESIRDDMKTNLLVAQGMRARIAALEPEIAARKRKRDSEETAILAAFADQHLAGLQQELANLQIKVAALTSFRVGQSHEWTSVSSMGEMALNKFFGGKQSVDAVNTFFYKQLRNVILTGGDGTRLPMPRQRIEGRNIVPSAYYEPEDFEAAFAGVEIEAPEPAKKAPASETEKPNVPAINDDYEDDFEPEIIEFEDDQEIAQ